MKITNIVMDEIITPEGTLNFGSLIKNTSVVTALLDSIDLSPDAVDGLFSGYLHTDKVGLFLMTFTFKNFFRLFPK